MGQALSDCVGPCCYQNVACRACPGPDPRVGTGKCKTCKGQGIILSNYDREIFSYILDKKGAYRDVKEEFPKQCARAWNLVPSPPSRTSSAPLRNAAVVWQVYGLWRLGRPAGFSRHQPLGRSVERTSGGRAVPHG
jgi:hypothetical protein